MTDGPKSKKEWKEHYLAMDDFAIRSAAARFIAAGARASLMILFDELIKEHKLDKFYGKEAAE